MGKNLKITDKIESYINKFSYQLNPVQKAIISYNESLGDIKKMQIAISQCHFLHLIIKAAKIKKVMEIGTFTGLSALSIALALPEDGNLIALDKNEETNKVAIDFFKKANQDKKIEIIAKPAFDSLKDFKINNKKFDMIFIDADKENYKNYYDKSIELLNNDGFIVVDNVLWHGDVVDEAKNDKFTADMRNFNIHVHNDSRTEQIIMPLGDGLTVCRKL